MFEPKYHYTDKMVSTLIQIAKIKENFDNSKLIPLYENRLKEKALIHAVNSNITIGGNQLTYEDTEAIIKNHESPKNKGEQEVINYSNTLNNILELSKLDFNKELFLNFHISLTRDCLEKKEYEGKFRDNKIIPDGVLNKNRKYGIPPASDVNRLIDDLLEWVHKDKDMCNIIEVGIFHYEFSRIHPFADGNGRTCRFLSALLSYKKNFRIRFFSISEYYNKDKKAYVAALENTDKTQDLTDWLEYFCEGVLFSINNIKYELFKLEESTTRWDNIINLSPTEIATLNLIDKYGNIQNKDVQKLFGISPQGSHKILKKLVDRNFIEAEGNGRGTKYHLTL